MSIDNVITIITGFVESGIIIFVLSKTILGLKKQISVLKKTIDVQNSTIEAMDKRLIETEKLSDLYKTFIEDYPKVFETYKTTIVKTKDEIIVSLQDELESQKKKIDTIDKSLKNNEQFVRISSKLLNKEYISIVKFIEQLDISREQFVYELITINSFEDFIHKLNMECIVENNIDYKEWMKPDKHPKTFSFNINGNNYVLTRDNKLLISAYGKEYFNNLIRELKK